MKPTTKTILYISLSVILMAFIFFQSSLPAELSSLESDGAAAALADIFKADVDLMSMIVRKSGHFAEYLLLGASLFASVSSIFDNKAAGKKLPDRFRLFHILCPWITGTVYAVTDEFHQYFVPGRSCELRDVIIDCCGVLAGVLIIRAIALSRKRRRT